MIKPFLIALQFLTCIPVRFSALPNEKMQGASLLYYPLVGLLIGLLLAILSWILSNTPPLVASALLLSSWILLTGGLHLDGLADSADAWAGGRGDKEKTLAIMKDPNCGAAGATAIALIILLKFVAIHSLFIASEWMTLLVAATFSRTMILVLFLTTPYLRSHGLGSSYASHQPRHLSIFIIVLTLVIILSLSCINYFWLLIAAILVFLLLRRIMMQRIHGMTGDTAGAMIEMTELGMLLTAVIFVI